MATKTENWEIGDFSKHFLGEARKAEVEMFEEKFHALGGELESLDAEFMRENMACATELPHLLEQLSSLTGRLGYCETDRGFGQTCDMLYGDVDTAIETAQSLNEKCFM